MGALCGIIDPTICRVIVFEGLNMKIQLITLFPEMFTGVLNSSMLWKAQNQAIVEFEIMVILFPTNPKSKLDLYRRLYCRRKLYKVLGLLIVLNPLMLAR